MSPNKKCLIVGDLHLAVNNLAIAKRLFELTHKIISTQGITDLILLGDLQNTKALVRSECETFLLDQLYQLLSVVDVRIIVGNHDRWNLGSDYGEHALHPLKLLNRDSVKFKLYLYDKPTYVSELNSLFVPYMNTNSEFLDAVSSYARPDKFVNTLTVICHQGFMGYDYGNGVKDLTGVVATDLPKNTQAICGHYHAFQNSENLVYIGTPFSHTFGECNQQKHIGIWNACDPISKIQYISTKTILPTHIKIEANSSLEKSGQ